MHCLLGQSVACLIRHRQDSLLGHCSGLLRNLLHNIGVQMAELAFHFTLTDDLRLDLMSFTHDGSHLKHARHLAVGAVKTRVEVILIVFLQNDAGVFVTGTWVRELLLLGTTLAVEDSSRGEFL